MKDLFYQLVSILRSTTKKKREFHFVPFSIEIELKI